MNETILAIVVILASLLLAYIDPSKSGVSEYVIVSLVSYIVGLNREKLKPKGVRKHEDG